MVGGERDLKKAANDDATKPAVPSTRERILDTAMELFARQGFRGTAISEIERRVGLAAGTGSLYHHFPSKEALLRAAVQREVDLRRAEMAESRAQRSRMEDTPESLALWYENTLRDIRRFERLYRLMLNEAESVPELREAIWTALQDPSDTSGWEAPVEAVANAALAGYHLFSMMQGRPYVGIGEHEFIATLVALVRRESPPTSS